MRPDVAMAFDASPPRHERDGHALVINSAFRSDAEQAALFAANPDPRMVAPPGTSLHRCGTELDLGPASAYGGSPRTRGASASCAGTRGRRGISATSRVRRRARPQGTGSARAAAPDGRRREPRCRRSSRSFRAAIARAASRWNVPAGLLAAQLMAESGFNPFAVSAAGARGIAQFMPGTAAAYGLRDPFDPDAAIDAQAHLMSDLLAQFGEVALALAAYNAGPAPVSACGCVPPYPETQAYVTRILGLLGGAGEIAPPALEVRLVG